MSNVFFRTSISPYRIDTYNALHDEMDFELYFLYKEDSSQNFNMQTMYDLCHFRPHFLKSFAFLKDHFRVCTEIGSILRTNQPEVVIVPEFKILALQVLIYKWLHRSKFRVISMCDDSFDMVTNDHDFSKAHKWARNIVTPLLDDLLLLDSKVVEWYKEHFGKGIWFPIIRDEVSEVEAYRRVLPISRRFQQEFGLAGQRILLFVGRLVDLKNNERIINALNRCKEPFTFVLVGSGEEEARLREAATRCNHRVVLAGRYEGDDVRAWYNLADVFILGSYLEAYGAVTNEALLAGCKCAISTHCGSSCLINESNGAILSPYDEEDIAAKLDSLMAGVVPTEVPVVKPHLMPFSFTATIQRVKSSLHL